ncbi:PHD finger-containing protein 1-like isoform X2 [Gastrolobium bilobum]|uniref:PHD finger-containing protein 1-like isoform X2 n=1 Tax=Gastrolobium bilobum TaxID=150636 RepID=UPI002AB2CFFA|nr:PHD finger-containing protein 1-like isoform X2 [Gastrolobium bilobum]
MKRIRSQHSQSNTMDTVCLKCGHEGFPETLVFCMKCEAYALHRYCLDGPVIFIDDVFWSCEDCERKVALPSSLHQSTLLSSGTTDSIILVNNAIQAKRELKSCIKRKKKAKVLLSDSRNSPEIINYEEARLDCHVDAQPIANPIWRGRLNVGHKTIGLLAHLSNLACSKVLGETELFPEVLRADLFYRSEVWPKSFNNGGPTDESIALYFFPENEGAEKVFDMLVYDIIRLELAIRFVAENAELLIFPSTVLLPMQHWRFHDKHYLWGVFRRRQTSLETNDAVSRKNADLVKILT